MDILTHIFLPLTLVYVLRRDFKAKHFPLALFAILPDFDVLTGIHRGLFHSIIFLLPISAFTLLVEYAFKGRIRYSLIALFFLYSHIILDFLAGGVPLLYPIVNQGVGVEFPFIIRFGESISIVDITPRLVYNYPQPVQYIDASFSGFGVASTALFLLIYWKVSREREDAGDIETKRLAQALKAVFWRLLEILDLALGWLLVGLAALLAAHMFLAGRLARKLEGLIVKGDKSKQATSGR
jgi:membrane-bound metal-dependent hydrolase YbcI (DUF457 family)